MVRLPPPNIHVVERGETLYSISRRFNIDTRSLAVMNGLTRPWTVWPGDEILLPPLAREDSRRAKEAAARSAPKREPNTGVVALKPGAAAKLENAKPVGAVSNPPGRHAFIWPVAGPVLQAYGEDRSGLKNDGINISATKGTQIVASADGEVVYVGDELIGFGNLILIQHAEGYVTAYGHADRTLVREGQKVKQGQAIAEVGSTGLVTEPQVHFELRKGKTPVDPASRVARG